MTPALPTLDCYLTPQREALAAASCSPSLRVLVACEYSGAVRDAFRALGHDALSCDLLPTDADGAHYCGDVRDLTEAAAKGDSRSQLALDVFVYAIRHYVGAFMLELGGIDAITFSGGIGENSWETRAAVLKNLTAFGIELDEQKNRAATGLGAISTETSPVKILIVPANEELIVARETVKVVEEARK